LVTSGIGYTATLTDDDGVVSIKGNAKAEAPAAQYQINFAGLSRNELSSFGGSTTVTFRVNDKDGGVVTGNNVEITAKLPEDLLKAGLLTLDGSAKQNPNSKGEVTFVVRVPTGLTADQRKQLEQSLTLRAIAVENSGASTEANSPTVKVSANGQQSATELSSSTNPTDINLLQDSFQIQVRGKRPDGSAAVDKTVTLKLDPKTAKAFSIENNTEQTNSKGVATFTVNIDQSLTPDERKNLNGSLIKYIATLSDTDGDISGTFETKAKLPIAQYRINFSGLSRNELSSFGGSTTVIFRLNDRKGGIIADQEVTAKLPDYLVKEGLLTLDSAATQKTDSKGEVKYIVRVPANLSETQRAKLEKAKDIALTGTVVEESGATSRAASPVINVSATQQSATELSSNTTPSVVNVLQDSFQIRVLGKRPNGSAAAGKTVELNLDPIKGVSVQGDTATTDSKGVAVFTVNIDPALSADERKDIADKGIAYSTTLTDTDGRVSGNFKAQAEVPAAQYQINFAGLSRNELSSFGGSTTVTFRVNDKDGGIIKDQVVAAVLPIALTDQGLLTLDGSSTQKTNEKGEVSFIVRIPEGLDSNKRAEIEKASGFELTTAIVEASGASSTATSAPIKVSAKGQQSATELSSSTNPSTINVLQDSFQIRVLGKRPNGSAAASKTVKLDLNPIKGVSVQGDTATTDSKGVAVFTVNIDPALSETDRKNIAAANIKYTATLSDTDGDISGSFEAQADMPDAQYQINFDNLTSNQLLSAGGSTTLTFRVNDKQGGIVKDQRVIAELPDDTLLRGLISLESASEQITDAKGEVKYTVRIPTGLTQTQRKALENRAKVFLKAYAIEASGAKTNVANAPILIKAGEIELVTYSEPQVIDIATARYFEITVLSRYPDSSAAFGKNVKLSIDKPTIFTIENGKHESDEKGQTVFKVRIDPNLTEAQKDAFVASGIKYTASILDENGVQSEVTNTIKVVKSDVPTSTISFASILSPSISEFGGDGLVKVKLATKKAPITPAAKQTVKLELDAQALSYGVKVKNDSAVTDFNGEATFEISIPESLSSEKRAALKRNGINYLVSYEEKGTTYTSANQKVNITTPTVALTVLNAPTQIDSRPGFTLNDSGESVTVSAQLSNKTENNQISGQPVKFAFDNKSLAQLLTVNNQIGSAEIAAVTSADGTVSFNVTLPNNLTTAQKDQFKNKVLTATLTETLTGKIQQVKVKVQPVTAGLSLISTQAKPLNLSGGETQIEVTAQNDDKNVVANQKVFFALPAAIASQGVTLLTDTQITNDSGKAVFTLAVPNNLTDAQKTAIGSSFNFALSAVDGINNQIVTKLGQIATIRQSSNGTQESLTIGANKVVSTKGDSFKVFVRVTDINGVIADRDVRLNVDDPVKTGVSIASNTVKTNGDGVATFDLKLEPGANVNQALLERGIKLTARTTTSENVSLSQDYIVAVDTTTIDNYQILVSSDKPTLNTGGDQTNAVFRVTDGKGGVLQGVPVQLSINDLVTSGAALTTPSVVTTDSDGKIDVGVLLAANSINARLNHEIKIDAKIITPVYDANGDVSLQTREEKQLILSAVGTKIELTAATTRLKDGESTAITTQIKDGSGLAIANAEMELVDEDGNLIASNAKASTDADGKAVFSIREDQLTFDSNGNLRVYARAVGENRAAIQRSTASINLIKDSRAGISFTNIKDIYEVNQPQVIDIQIRTDSPEQAAALVGKSVEVQTSLGALIANYLDKFNNDVVITKPIKATDIQGNNINVKVWLKSSLAGTAVVQATVLGENLQNGTPRYQVTTDTRFKAVTPAKMLFQAVKTVITPGSSTEVVAIVKDKNDVPVEGQTVVFSRSADSSAGRLSAATAVTDSKGEARVVYQANASSPIGGVVINARLLEDSFGIGTKTTNITVSKEAVYTTLAFGNKVASDNIYYTIQGSISVMDGSGRAVANQEVSIKSYAVEYAQGRVCALDSTMTYQPKDIVERDEQGKVIKVTTPEAQVMSEISPILLSSGWYPTEDANYNYTLDKDRDFILNEDRNNNNTLEAINPVAIIGGTVSADGYSFVTDSEGRADFVIRYPMRYSHWVKVRFDASTFVNGSENMQSINYALPMAEGDLGINGDVLQSPWISNTSPFGSGGATCTDSMSVIVNENTSRTKVILSPYQPNEPGYFVTINGDGLNYVTVGYNSFIVDFNSVFEKGSIINVNRESFDFSKIINVGK
ncbi:hypothetical protein, partial [Psychrobacter ciconiae]|uniref:hypothetical protein n=1 Tax=Psychrobacter ciconiae TaxID=1553449 RepID=UPI0016614CB0